MTEISVLLGRDLSEEQIDMILKQIQVIQGVSEVNFSK